METENEVNAVGVCAYCDTEKPLDDLITTGRGNLACNDSSCSWKCHECENFFTHNRTAHHPQGYPNRSYCLSCLRDGDFDCCAHCSEWLPTDDSCWIEASDSSVCESCRDNRYSWCDRCEVYDYNYSDHDHSHNGSDFLHSYGDYPDWLTKRTGEDDTSKVLMGIEIETGVKYSDEKGNQADHIGTTWGESELYITEDGSVNGFEVKTHPMTLAYAKGTHDWSWLQYLRSEGHSGWDETHAGIHIHVDREAFDNASHLMKFLMFIYGNSLDVSIFAGRVADYASFNDRSNLRRKARTNSKRVRDYYGVAQDVWSQNGDDSFPADMLRFPEFMDRVKDVSERRGMTAGEVFRELNERLSNYGSAGNRNSAVNVTHQRDVEVRIFRSSLRKERVLAIFEFVHSMVEFTRPLSTRDLVQGGLKWDVYLEFMRKNDSFYDNFARNMFAWKFDDNVFEKSESELIALLNNRSSRYGGSPISNKGEFNKNAFKTHMLTLEDDYYVTANTEEGY